MSISSRLGMIHRYVQFLLLAIVFTSSFTATSRKIPSSTSFHHICPSDQWTSGCRSCEASLQLPIPKRGQSQHATLSILLPESMEETQNIESVTANGVELLRSGPCSPSVNQSGSAMDACGLLDVSYSLFDSHGYLYITLRASPAAGNPLHCHSLTVRHEISQPVPNEGPPAGIGHDSGRSRFLLATEPSLVLDCQLSRTVTPYFGQLRTVLSANQSPVHCSVQSGVQISGVDPARISVTNGTATAGTVWSNISATFDVLPGASGFVTVSLMDGALLDASGSPMSISTAPLSFVFDTTRPSASLSTATKWSTADSLHHFLVSFSDPVFNFTPSGLSLLNANVTCFTAADGGAGRFFSLTVQALEYGSVAVSVGDAVAWDWAGNPNLASEQISFTYYKSGGGLGSVGPGVVSGVLGWTYLITATVTAATSIQEFDPSASPGIRIVSDRPFTAVSTPLVGGDPSRNLLRMVLHLQVFALSENLAVPRLPVLYRRVTSGLRWLYFFIPAPFLNPKVDKTVFFPASVPGPNGTYSTPVSCPWTLAELSQSSLALPASYGAGKWLTGQWSLKVGDITPFPASVSTSGAPELVRFGPEVLAELSVDEQAYQASWTSNFSTNYPFLQHNYHGFMEFAWVVFYSLAVISVLSLGQFLAQLAVRRCYGQWLYGIMEPPRLTFAMIAASLAGISWACARVIVGSRRGGSLAGVVVGVVALNLWAVPFILLAAMAVWLIVVQEQAARFFVREMTEPRSDSPFQRMARSFWALTLQKRLKGHWVTITPEKRHYLPRFGIFFEEYTVWDSSHFLGKLGDRFRALFGVAEYLKMTVVGAIFGVWSKEDSSGSQIILLLVLSAVHLMYLWILRPFTERRIQVVESVSVVAEAAIFACALAMQRSGESMADGTRSLLGALMVAIALFAFGVQIFNHWCVLGQQISRIFSAGVSEDEEDGEHPTTVPSRTSVPDIFSDDDIYPT